MRADERVDVVSETEVEVRDVEEVGVAVGTALGLGVTTGGVVGTLVARRALRRGVGASTCQRRGEGVHQTLGCGLALLGRKKCRMRPRALSHSGPLSKTACACGRNTAARS